MAAFLDSTSLETLTSNIHGGPSLHENPYDSTFLLSGETEAQRDYVLERSLSRDLEELQSEPRLSDPRARDLSYRDAGVTITIGTA